MTNEEWTEYWASLTPEERAEEHRMMAYYAAEADYLIDVDVVAEAIYTANTGAAVPWDDLNDWGHGEYRRLAQAAIDAVTDR